MKGRVELQLMDAAGGAPPARVRAFEEDSFMVMSAPPEIPEEGPHPIRVMTAVWDAAPKPVPSLEKRGRNWLLILHDLEAEPSTDEAILREGLQALFDEAERDRVESVEVPLLGAVHGVISPTRAAAILIEVLSAKWFHHLERVIVREVPAGEVAQQIRDANVTTE